MFLRRILMLSVASFFVLGVVGCDEDYERFDESGPVVPRTPVGADEWVLDVNIDGTSADYTTDEMPTGSAVAPQVVAAGQIVRGGSLVMSVTVDDSVDDLLVGVASADFGYFSLDLGAMSAQARDAQSDRARARDEKLVAAGRAPQTAPRAAARAPREVWVNLTSATDFAGTGFTVRLVTVTDGVFSAPVHHNVTVNSVAAGSSQLQVSLNWVHPVDMDLHVLMPNEELIYFANKVGSLGGELDLDSNPACSLDYVQNENITWRTTDPITGEYVVFVHLWSACDATTSMPYVVTVRRGEQVTSFEGSFVPADDGTSAREITRFTID